MRRSNQANPATCRVIQPKCGELSPIQESRQDKRWLIEEAVLFRLEEIFEAVKALMSRDPGQTPDQDRAIRLPEVLQLLGISRSCLYDRLNPRSASHDPDMPRPFKLGATERAPSVWQYSSVMAYRSSRTQLHHGKGG